MSSANTILITGGNTGLGLEIVRALSKEAVSYNIIIGSRNLEKGIKAVTQIQEELPQSQSKLSTVQIDVLSDDSIRGAVEYVASTFGKLDVLINNAGANFDHDIQGGKLSQRDGWNLAWNTNVTGAHVTTVEFVPLLLQSASPDYSSSQVFAVINASPEAGWPKPQTLNPTESYRSSKAGLNMMMRQWYRILKNDGVKVFAVSPGFLATGLAGLGEETLRKMGARDPAIGGNFVKDVVLGKRDADEGKAIYIQGIQPW
ncbi:hypothetical protein N7468_002567 [Penicillium chermesinum]|uniref:NAD(P)-binding protein n=1 Tax=Penicillium chermesinum TaxID=63820 RepID=A0A9W9TZQ0_9EURO|nr:uncharacterized protein N7468_002567 [Penicillium chermesinum]KAJ5247584.1 hypothetical protein N7468_002567 [Penicillium chermesinum]